MKGWSVHVLRSRRKGEHGTYEDQGFGSDPGRGLDLAVVVRLVAVPPVEVLLLAEGPHDWRRRKKEERVEGERDVVGGNRSKREPAGRQNAGNRVVLEIHGRSWSTRKGAVLQSPHVRQVLFRIHAVRPRRIRQDQKRELENVQVEERNEEGVRLPAALRRVAGSSDVAQTFHPYCE